MIRQATCIILLVALCAIFACQAAADEIVTAVTHEDALDLSGTWRYMAVSQVEDSLFATSKDDSSWPSTFAPARWTVQKIDAQSANAVVYRRRVRVPTEWKGVQVGISAWFCSSDSLVYINGQQVEPTGPPNALYADVSDLLQYGADNLVAVSATADGVRELAEMDPPLLGPLGQKHLTKVVRKSVSIPATGQPLRANLFLPDDAQHLPVVVFAATGHADYSLKDDWKLLNEDLGRLGYASLAVAFNRFTPEEFEAVFRHLGSAEGIDPARVALVGAMKATRPVVLAAGANPGVRALVLVSSARIPEISLSGDRPVLFLCSEKESSVPAVSAAKAMAEVLAGPYEIAALPGSASGVAILDTGWNRFRETLLDWLDRYLR